MKLVRRKNAAEAEAEAEAAVVIVNAVLDANINLIEPGLDCRDLHYWVEQDPWWMGRALGSGSSIGRLWALQVFQF
jgi:hypothetical protein